MAEPGQPRQTTKQSHQRPAKGNGHAGPAGGPGRNAQGKGISQRVAQHALQGSPGHGQRAAAQGGQAHAGQPNAHHHPGKGGIIGRGRKPHQGSQRAEHACSTQIYRPRQTGQRQRGKPQHGQTGKNRPQPAAVREGGRRCGNGHAGPLAMPCGQTRAKAVAARRPDRAHCGHAARA